MTKNTGNKENDNQKQQANSGHVEQVVSLPCPFCGCKGDKFYMFDQLRAGCSDDDCIASFGDDGVGLALWNKRAN